MDHMARMQLFAVALLLKGISNPEAIKRLSKMHSAYSDGRKATGLLMGYKLIVEAILYKQIELIVTCPEVLHLQLDDVLCRWWLNAEDKSARNFKGITYGDVPNSTIIANYINDLLLRVVRTGNRLTKFTHAARDAMSLAQMMLMLARKCDAHITVGDEADLKQDIDQALRLCGAEHLYDLVYDIRDHTLNDTFDYTHTGSLEWVEGSILEGLGISAVETSRDVVGTRPRRLRGRSEFSNLGINAAVAIAIEALTGRNRVAHSDDTNLLPVEQLFGDLLEEFQVGKWPSTRYGLIFQNGLPEKELEEFMVRETSTTDPQEYLKALLRDNAYLVSGLSNNAEFHFQVLIEGLAKARPTDIPIEVLQIEHTGVAGEPHPPVSLAVRVGHDWYVFYYIDAVGRMKSWVWNFLDELGDRVRRKTVRGVSTDFLLCLCDRAFQYVARQWKTQKDLNTHLRGIIPELLAGLLLGRLNYSQVRTSFELKGIGEIDAIGYKHLAEGGECKIVEVKRRSTNQIQLRSEIKDFIDKVQSIQQNLEAVEEALRSSGSIEEVSGLFISMAEIGDLNGAVSDGSKPVMGFFDTTKSKAEFKSFLDGLSQIEFWDYFRFNRELESAELPELPIRLLEHAKLTWMLPDVNLDEEVGMWDTLQKSVENDNWQWPDSSDAVKGKLEDTLRSE